MLDYGLEGYGLYWYCIELIAGKVDKDHITFELEHDARIIARNTGSTPQKVEEMMRYFVKVGLFESSEGLITCLKLAKRLDTSMTSNPQMREIINNLKSHDGVMTASANPMQDKIRLDKTRIDKKKNTAIGETPIQQQQQIIEIYNGIFHMLPRAEVLTDNRKSLIQNFMDNRKREKPDYSVDELSGYFKYIANNCTWMLKEGCSQEGKIYKPKSFNYFMTDDCYAAVKEQRYNDEGI